MLSFKCTENKVHFWSIKKNYLITEPRGPERYRASWQHIWILTQSWPEPFFLPVLISPQQNLIFTFLLLLKLQRKESFFQDFYHFYTAVVRFWDIFILIKADQTIQGSNFLKRSMTICKQQVFLSLPQVSRLSEGSTICRFLLCTHVFRKFVKLCSSFQNRIRVKSLYPCSK